MKKLLSVLLAVLLIFTAAPVSFAATTEGLIAAKHLNELGLFAGTGNNPDGSPNFNLDAVPDRHQGITMLVGLLGKSQEAGQMNYNMPFTDVAKWARPFVGYAYAHKLSAGTSPTTFGGSQKLTASQYVTFVLGAMGYKNNVDFIWSDPFALSDMLGITGGKYNPKSHFTRGDVAIISNNALNAKMKDSDLTLLDSLIASGAVKDPNASTPTPVPQVTPTPAPQVTPTPVPQVTPDPDPTQPPASGSVGQKLADYISSHGSTTSDGVKRISTTVEASDGESFTSSIEYNANKGTLFFSSITKTDDYSTGTGMSYLLTGAAFNRSISFVYLEGSETLAMSASIDPATYDGEIILTFQKVSGPDGVDMEAAQKTADYYATLAVYLWSAHLDDLGFDIADLGFTALQELPGDDPAATPTPVPTPEPTPTPVPTPTATPIPVPTPGPGYDPDKDFTGKYLGTQTVVDGGSLTMHVGDRVFLRNPGQPISVYYTYWWDINSGKELVYKDFTGGDDAVHCAFNALAEGKVEITTVMQYAVYTIGVGSTTYTKEYHFTLIILPAEGDSGDNSGGDSGSGSGFTPTPSVEKTCPKCHGRPRRPCGACGGDGIMDGTGRKCTTPNCTNGTIICDWCDGSGKVMEWA